MENSMVAPKKKNTIWPSNSISRENWNTEKLNNVERSLKILVIWQG